MATHWKRLVNPNYLGSYAFNPGEEKTATIKAVKQESVTGSDGGVDECIVCYFKEDLKPLILNKTNCKVIEKLAGSPYIEDWANLTIVMRVQKVNAFGELVDAVRVKSMKKGQKQSEPEAVIKCADCKKPITGIGEYSAEQVAAMNKSRFGRAICGECSRKLREKQEAKAKAEKAIAEIVEANDKPLSTTATADESLSTAA